MYRGTIAEIDLNNIVHNIDTLTDRFDKDIKKMAVVKADAYGHGSVQVANTAISAGVDFLAVASVEEAVELRVNGISDIPILILGYSPADSAEVLEKYNITPTVYDLDVAKSLNNKVTSRIKVHVKVDSGMNRLGVDIKNVHSFLLELEKLVNIEVEGIFTHYATADERNNPYAKEQFFKFKDILTKLPYKIPFRHIANSAGIMERLTDDSFNMIRLGIAMYGLYPSNQQLSSGIELKPALELRTQVVHVKTVPEGTPISYGMTFTTEKETKIATLAIGYADGLFRGFSNKGFVMVKGNKAPILGRVCMDYTMVDVSGIDVKIGDEAIVYGYSGGNKVDNMAKIVNTINYELVCAISKRVPRIYKDMEG